LRDLGNRGERFFAVFRRGADIELAGGRVSSDHQKITARFQALVSRASGQDRNVTRFQEERAPFGAAELNLAGAARDAEHFVNARVIMRIVVDAVAPRVAPAIAFKQVLEHGGGIERFRQTDCALVDNERPFGMVGNKPVVLEPVSLRLALAQKRLGIVRPFPAHGFLGDAFDIFQETHRGDPDDDL
jgi:hypothetical protein